ncbi:MAG: class I SAM-dependent methyltransferase [Candidatus Omnitrophica bacterium]|nr:class I SAM-dependent methyltransferase [Candidatus Omnitrophota bacterium]
MEIDAFKKKLCRYCDSLLPESFLDLGSMPLANNLPRKEDLDKKEFECPLSLVHCPSCHLIQLSHAVPADLMFSHYLYVSSTTKTFREHFAAYAKDVRGRLKNEKDPLAVDIGSNDGLLLSCYQNEGMRIVGVDPAANLCKEANEKGLTTLNRYFDEESVNLILKDFGKAHVISGNNVFAHIDDIQSVIKNVDKLLDDQGFFVIEFPYLGTMLEELLFDMIYHEHVSYIGLHALSHFAGKFGFEIFDILPVASHGGSFRVFMQKKGASHPKAKIVDEFLTAEKNKGYLTAEAYQAFAGRVLKVKEDFMQLVSELKAAGKSISGYGAPAKASTIINFYGLTPDQVDYVVDDNPLKQNRYIPGAHIPIVPSSHLEAHPTDYVVIFAWNFAKEITQKIGHLRQKGVQFIIPLFNPRQAQSTESLQKAFEVAAS